MSNRVRISSATGVYDPRTGRYYSEVVTNDTNNALIEKLDVSGNGYQQNDIVSVDRYADIEDAIVELAQNQADLEDAIVELAELIGGE